MNPNELRQIAITITIGIYVCSILLALWYVHRHAADLNGDSDFEPFEQDSSLEKKLKKLKKGWT